MSAGRTLPDGDERRTAPPAIQWSALLRTESARQRVPLRAHRRGIVISPSTNPPDHVPSRHSPLLSVHMISVCWLGVSHPVAASNRPVPPRISTSGARLASGDVEGAIRAYERCYGLGPDSPHGGILRATRTVLGFAHLEGGDPAHGRALLTAAEREDRRALRAGVEFGGIHYDVA